MDEPRRPTPQELLRRYGRAMHQEGGRRGRLRIFLGAAPGVGKTYAMLNDARHLARSGRDVVVGFVETHGRAETEAQIGDLEVLPRLRVPYRGVIVEELDTEAVLRRSPEVVLVDELAHTNAPGSPRTKRYEDVELLLDAGIDVVTTLNVQHLEGLQDVIEGITGIEVRETVPDRVLHEASDVQLIDLPVDQLIERLEQGKVYPTERARQALENFFRAGNLNALRELALRRTAAGVDEQLESYMREHEIADVWPASERVVVLVDDSLSAGTVLRNAWRLASALRAELIAVTVAPLGGSRRVTPEQRTGLDRNVLLAEDLGARIESVTARSTAYALASLAKRENATIVVIGHRPATWWEQIWRRSVVDQLLQQLENVDVYVVERAN
jgi:two-component system sensor histidine kinase KdpD